MQSRLRVAPNYGERQTSEKIYAQAQDSEDKVHARDSEDTRRDVSSESRACTLFARN